jgi:hypothetical protein
MPSSNVDFSILKDSRDTLSIYSDLLRLRKGILPEYTNEDLSDPGNTLLLLLSGVADYLHLRADIEAEQFQLDRAVRKSSVMALLNLIGTTIQPPVSATADLIVTLVNGALSEDLVIPKNTLFNAPEVSESFVSIEDVTLPAGSTSVIVPVMHGSVKVETLGQSDGTANQIFVIPSDKIVQNNVQKTIKVIIGTQEWEVVDSLAFSTKDDRHLAYRRMADGTSQLICGDGINGKIPAEGDIVRVEFIEGGGTVGNVGAGKITEVSSVITLNGEVLSLSCTNPNPASGGADEQSLAQAKLIGPHVWRSQDRAVTLKDYEVLTKSVAGVLDARAKRTGLTVVTVYVAANNSTGNPSNTLLSIVKKFLEERKMTTDDLLVAAPKLAPVNVTISVIAKPGEDLSVVTRNVTIATKDFFDVTKRAANGEDLFGDPNGTRGHIYLFDYGAKIDNTNGVDKVNISAFTRSIVPNKVTWTGNADFSDFAVSSSTVNEVITVVFYTTTTYMVKGSVSGALGTGVLDSVFSDRDGKISFKIKSGTQPMAPGDTATFSVSPLVGNILLDSNEIAYLGTFSLTVTG